MGLSALYTGATGMKTHGKTMQVVGNNLANVSTIGFKQQMAILQDLHYSDVDSASVNGAGRADGLGVGKAQLGFGSTVAEVRTLHKQGPFDPGAAVTDIGISGKGFFGVSKDGQDFYTRAGNFRFNNEGYLQDPGGYRLQGRAIENGVVAGSASDILIAPGEDGLITQDPKVTSSVNLITNLGSSDDLSTDATDPYFALLKSWDGTQESPGAGLQASYSAPITVYDEQGGAHELTVYYDRVSSVSNAGAGAQYEFIVTMPPGEDGRGLGSSAGTGLLMAGVMSFDTTNNLTDVAAFTPSGDPALLSNWSPATFASDGSPQMNVSFASGGTQPVSLNFGVSSTGSAWDNAPANAAAIGSDATLMPQMNGVKGDALRTTAYDGSSSTLLKMQDGYAEGYLTDINIDREGVISGRFSNGESEDLWQISLYRFNSEFGLKREGGNHFSASTASGAAQEGLPETENFGSISSNSLEQSNVDMATEFVRMITTQRGYQANSKIITTQNSIVEKTIQIKR